jgi:ribosome-binding protein aMBF1 (putative translation factor)
MEHQDWEQYIIHCNSDKKEKKEKKEKEKKTGPNHFLKDIKLDKKIEEGDLKHQKINKELSKQIQQARLSKGYTQKDLANKLSLQASIINDIECGRAIYNGQQISKIKRILGIKLN